MIRLVPLGIAALLSSIAAADSMRCGTHIIDVGVFQAELLEKCGPPTTKQGDIWIYERSSSSDPFLVRIGNGKVQSIQTEMAARP